MINIAPNKEIFNFMTCSPTLPALTIRILEYNALNVTHKQGQWDNCRRAHIITILDSFAAMVLDWITVIIVVLFMLFAFIELRSRGFGTPTSLSRGRMSVNFGTAILTAATELVIPIGTIAAALFASQNDIGLFNMLAAPVWLIFVTALMGRTFIMYWLHRGFHQIPLLWRMHRIHHSDPYFDISVGVRQHPFILAVSMPIYLLSIALLGLPVWSVILVDTIMFAALFWEHIDAPLPKSLARPLGLLFVTPNIHRVHHSSWQPQTNSNYGTGFVIWDRLFGTYVEPEHARIARIGLGDADDAIANSLWRQLCLPFRPPT